MSTPTESAGLPVITPQELIEFLALAKTTKLPLMVRGGPGVGKSSIFRQFAATQGDGYGYLDSRAIYFDPTDIKGFPRVNGRVTEWLPPAEFPTQGEGMWVIEELPSAAPAVQAAFYQLMLDRQIGAYRLPDGWFIVATGNRLIDKGLVNRMPSPLVSRMSHVELQVSIDAWTEHALDRGIVPELIAFFRLRAALLNNFDPKNWVADTPYCCPRTVEFLSRLMHASNGKPSLKLVWATIGESAGIEFYSFLDVYKEVPSLYLAHLKSAAAMKCACRLSPMNRWPCGLNSRRLTESWDASSTKALSPNALTRSIRYSCSRRTRSSLSG